jgi:hypothetical protein
MTHLDDLSIPISELNLGKQFTDQAERLGLKSLYDVMQADFKRIKEDKEFSYIWYSELLSLLKKKGLLHRFQENQL